MNVLSWLRWCGVPGGSLTLSALGFLWSSPLHEVAAQVLQGPSVTVVTMMALLLALLSVLSPPATRRQRVLPMLAGALVVVAVVSQWWVWPGGEF